MQLVGEAVREGQFLVSQGSGTLGPCSSWGRGSSSSPRAQVHRVHEVRGGGSEGGAVPRLPGLRYTGSMKFVGEVVREGQFLISQGSGAPGP